MSCPTVFDASTAKLEVYRMESSEGPLFICLAVEAGCRLGNCLLPTTQWLVSRVNIPREAASGRILMSLYALALEIKHSAGFYLLRQSRSWPSSCPGCQGRGNRFCLVMGSGKFMEEHVADAGNTAVAISGKYHHLCRARTLLGPGDS